MKTINKMMRDDNRDFELKMTKKDFSERVELHAISINSYLDALTEICENEEIDFENVMSYVTSPLLEKIKHEAENRNLLKAKQVETYTLF